MPQKSPGLSLQSAASLRMAMAASAAHDGAILTARVADPAHARRCCVFKLAVPVLHVASSSAAEAFYCGQLGFRREFEYRPVPDNHDPCYMAQGCGR